MNTHQAKRDFVITTGIELVQKFGFLPRSIVWKHLSPGSQASKYYYWQLLSNSPQFAPYDLGIKSPDHLMMSSENRQLLGDAACVRTRSATYFKHDEFLMDFILHLKKLQLVSRYWTEQELKKDRTGARQILGGDPYDKIPDLVFDLSVPDRVVRAALENERTRKSQERYKRMHFGYRRLKHLDLILFAICDTATESAIRREFDRQIFSSSTLPYGCFLLEKFSKETLGCEIRIQGKAPVLGRLLSSICGREFPQRAEFNETDLENRWNPFQTFSEKNRKAE